MFVKKYGDICVSIFYMAIGIALILMAKQLPESTVMAVGPDFMPTLIGSICVVLSAILLVTTLVNLKKNIAKVEAEGVAKCDYLRVALSFIGIVVYAFALRTVGFILLTIVFLPFEMFNLCPDEKRSVKELITLIIISVIFTLVVFFLFRYGFKILLPAGLFTLG